MDISIKRVIIIIIIIVIIIIIKIILYFFTIGSRSRGLKTKLKPGSGVNFRSLSRQGK